MSFIDDAIGGAKRVVAGVLLRLEVISLLRSATVGQMDFKYGKYRFKGEDYASLATDIALGKVGVFTDTLEAGSGAEYHQSPTHSHPNSLVFPTTWNKIGTSVWRRMSGCASVTKSSGKLARRSPPASTNRSNSR